MRQRKPGAKLNARRSGRYAGRVRLTVVSDRRADALCGFLKNVVAPGTKIITDDWSGYAGLSKYDYDHAPIAQRGDPQVTEEFMPISHLVFSNRKTWPRDIHHGVSPHRKAPKALISASKVKMDVAPVLELKPDGTAATCCRSRGIETQQLIGPVAVDEATACISRRRTLRMPFAAPRSISWPHR